VKHKEAPHRVNTTQDTPISGVFAQMLTGLGCIPVDRNETPWAGYGLTKSRYCMFVLSPAATVLLRSRGPANGATLINKTIQGERA
jgi:hypothetical protein